MGLGFRATICIVLLEVWGAGFRVVSAHEPNHSSPLLLDFGYQRDSRPPFGSWVFHGG